MTVQHFNLSDTCPYVHSTYLGSIKTGDQTLGNHPGSYTISNDLKPMRFSLFHGRFDPAADMDDWGFEGPILEGLTLAHDTDRILLQNADSHSVELAKRMGLEVAQNTIILHYIDDLVVVPKFQGDRPAYFGDHSAARA